MINWSQSYDIYNASARAFFKVEENLFDFKTQWATRGVVTLVTVKCVFTKEDKKVAKMSKGKFSSSVAGLFRILFQRKSRLI
jgi:hypothetical protein